MGQQSENTPDQAASVEHPAVLRLEPRHIARRIPGIGLARFRAPAASAEEALEPLYSAEVEARIFANALIAACVESPAVEAADVDGWSERARAVARVAAAQTIGCFAAYRRFAGSDLDVDERLREAMRKRNEELAERLRLTIEALASSSNIVRMFEPSRLAATNAVEQMLRPQRQIERLLKTDSLIGRSLALQRPMPQLTRIEYTARLRSSPAFDSLTQLSRSPLFGQLEQLRKLSSLTVPRSVLPEVPAFDLGRSPFFGQIVELKKLAAFALPRNVGSDLAGIGRLASLASPSYFGALRGIGRTPDHSKLFGGVGPIPDYTKVFGSPGRVPDLSKLLGGIGNQLHVSALTFQHDAVSRLLERMRGQVAGPARAYLAWVEREWAQAKAEHRPAPVLFVLASLPALVGLQLLEELRADDEPLLSSLEQELEQGGLATALQTAIQRNVLLDSVAKRHLTQGVDWVAAGRYIDAAPPLYQGLERAFRLTARGRGVVDTNGNFLVPDARRGRMRKIEDTFHHLALDHLYLRFLRAWVFGDVGNLARHGDLPEVEHRKWVLRAVVALVGWLEYVGGEQDAVAELVARLGLEPGESQEVVA